ncbi:aminotransferase class I/II-fold pyridoxal phosphate-dependent enzyme [Saccharopolyspora elongata]|uniref:Aminotransferase class I/II-fold pyridoxal phosphate-dependent enzyme n=1 Tax=Saccharopolyspora elongata TaxID=2530387 RepID=A0A4V2YJR1_9PSEU|nr:aminotransferase class I/II-fold pyridoxal phosphate-dependent enzyme [Saccharopolyspora elongata]TDD39857.1 aminotransferase class I/II-fold pyridoxal phosphate-dependent enzyme [Saccharopolyspora elongata]
MVADDEVVQSKFSDLYTAVYDLIDDAKRGHELVKLHKGSHGAANPHPVVQDVGAYFFRERKGIFSFVHHAVGATDAGLDALAVYDSACRPRVATRKVFGLLAECSRRDGERVEDFSRWVVSRQHDLGRYRGGSSGFDDEARSFAAAHFRSTGIPASPQEVLVCCGGAKGGMMAMLAAVMCRHEGEKVHRMSGRVLAPVGYYQSLRILPPIVGGAIDVAVNLDGHDVEAWLADTARENGRVIYAPLVNNVDGKALTESRARDIAGAVLEHNRRNHGNPVYVLGDDVYAGSYLAPGLSARPIGSVRGDEVGGSDLGNMSDWVLSVVTPSKTYALPTSRIAFAHTGNATLRSAVAHYRTMLSYGRVPQGDELTAAAAICLTPQHWIDQWNRTYAQRVDRLRTRLQVINQALGMDAFRLTSPDGGWYAALRIHPGLFADPRVRSSVHALAVCLYYGRERCDTGLGLLPGELSGYRVTTGSPEFILRASVAVGDDELDEFARRLAELGALLCSPARPAVITHALDSARSVVHDLDTIADNA